MQAAWLLRVLLVASALLGNTAALAVGRPHEPRVHPADVENEALLGVAEQLLRVNDAPGALRALWAIDESRPKLNRFARARLLGTASFATGRFEDAATALADARAIAAAKQTTLAPALELLRARAEYALGRCEQALGALTRAHLALFPEADGVLVSAACHEQAGRRAAAIDDLSRGIAFAGRAQVDASRLLAARARLFLGLGLFDAALSDALQAASDADLDTGLALANDLAEAGALSCSVALLRLLRHRFPDDAQPSIALARLAASREAADAALHAGRLDETRRADAAELLRRDGSLPAALRESANIADEQSRLRSRLAILIDAHAWDRALALRRPLDKAGLSAEDAVRYALAYAAFRVGDDEVANELLDGIVDPTTFERAARLRVAIAACLDREEQCER